MAGLSIATAGLHRGRRASRVRELWTDEDLGTRSGSLSIDLPPRGGKVLICTAT